MSATPLPLIGQISIGVIDANIAAAKVVRRILTVLGLSHISMLRNMEELERHLERHTLDMLLADMACPDGGLNLLARIRDASFSNRTLPVMLTAWHATEEDYATARDAGANEFLVRPYSVSQLYARLSNVVEAPRPFILSPRFTGPCRRRTEKVPAQERRKEKPLAIEASDLKEIFVDGKARQFTPRQGLRMQLEAKGMSMKGLENIMPAASARNHEDEYAQWLLADVEVIRQAVRNVSASPANARTYIERIHNAVHSIRMRSTAAEYGYAVRIAILMDDFIRRRFSATNPLHASAMGKHADALHIIFNQRLTGEDNAAADELLDELKALIERIS